MQQASALIASARIAFLLAGVLALSRSTVLGALLMAVACLSWGISVAVGACLCRSALLDARPQGDRSSSGAESDRAPSGRASTRHLRSWTSYGSTGPRRIA
jgi:hypothetical protein